MLKLNLPDFDFKIKETEGKRMIFDVLRSKYVALTPEEWVRQHFVQYLIREKHYPQTLLGNEIQIKLNGTTKRCDTIIYDLYLNPMMIVEYKAPSVTVTQLVFDQILRYNMTLRVQYLIVSNGFHHFCCRIDYKTMQVEVLKDIPDCSEV